MEIGDRSGTEEDMGDLATEEGTGRGSLMVPPGEILEIGREAASIVDRKDT